MSEQASPDYVETTQKEELPRRLNRLPIIVVGVLVTLALGNFIYTGKLREMVNVRAETTNEINKVPNIAASPITRPAGPDVNLASAAQVYSMPGEVQQPGAAMQEGEAERKVREKKAEALAAALNADPSVEKFSNKQASVSPVSTGHGNPQRPTMGMPPPPPGQLADDGMGGMLGGGASPVRNHSGFAQNNDTGIYLPHTREAALSPMEIKAGFIIPGVMVSGINSDLPGPIIGQVRQNVYDSATGRHLLIPAGAKLVGTYDSNVVSGEERVLIAWNRIIFPDGSSITLNNMPGADQGGLAGFNDQVDNHYLRTFGQALLLSALSAGMQIGQQPRGSANGQLSATQIAAASTAMQFGMLGMQSARRGLNIPPTMVIRPGFLFNIMVTKDIILPPWRGHPVAQVAVNHEGNEDD